MSDGVVRRSWAFVSVLALRWLANLGGSTGNPPLPMATAAERELEGSVVRVSPLGRFTRRWVWVLAGLFWAFAAAELAYGYLVLGYGRFWGFDLDIYRGATSRLLSGGSWFLPRQLAGPYVITNGDVLYPPVTAYLFAPFLVLPTLVFVAFPIAVIGWCVWRWRPGPLAIAAMAVCVAWPTTEMRAVSANPALWMVAFLALGLEFQWPAALVVLKPTLGVFALLRARARSWWLAIAILSVASLPFLAATLAYPGALLHVRGGTDLFYLLGDFPAALIPIAAWLGRTCTAGHPSVGRTTASSDTHG